MPTFHDNRHQLEVRRRARRSAFTLVEVLVALGVFFLLLTIILVPIRLAFDTLNIGRARSEVQQAAQVTVSQIQEDLKRAVYVFPNTDIPGITDKAPYSTFNSYPYVKSTDNSSTTAMENIAGPCSAGMEQWGNVSRIDMILPATAAGTITYPPQPSDTIVTYYPRRLLADDNNKWDVIDNPIVLFRAQFPFRNPDGSDFHNDGNSADPLNADVSKARFTTSCGGNVSTLNRQALWISHNFYGEANLAPLCDVDATSGTPTAFASHTLVTPTGMALVASHADDATDPSYLPDSSFVCNDSDDDGVLDRVDINLVMANYSASNAVSANGTPQGQIARITQSVACPNVQALGR